jgi:hypothetical protein
MQNGILGSLGRPAFKPWLKTGGLNPRMRAVDI